VGPFAPLLLAAVAQASASNAVVWHWNRQTQTCALQSVSSSGDTVEVSRTPANDETGIMLTVRSSTNVRDGRFGGAIKLDSGEQAVADVVTHLSEANRLQVYAVTQDPAFLWMLSSASWVEVSTEKDLVVRVPLRSTAAAVGALRDCEDKKMRDWGIDSASWHALRSKPVPLASLRDLFSDFDYPLNALTFLVTGDAATRLDVTPDGTVQRCTSLNASRYKGFAEATCHVLTGARFRPALDAAGNPISAPYVVDVTFRIAN
jgi:Gram-negative bacterial tonB protein.